MIPIRIHHAIHRRSYDDTGRGPQSKLNITHGRVKGSPVVRISIISKVRDSKQAYSCHATLSADQLESFISLLHGAIEIAKDRQ